MKILFLFLLALAQAETPLPAPQPLPWADKSVSALAWKYLHREHPRLEKNWPRFEAPEQHRLAAVAAEQGAERDRRARTLYQGFLNTCGASVSIFEEPDHSQKLESDPAHTRCDLRTVSQISDGQINDIGYWQGPPQAKAVWELRQGALRMLSDLRVGKLSPQDMAWARTHLHPQAMMALEQVYKTQSSGLPNQTQVRARARAAFMPDNFDPQKAAGQLGQASWDAGSAKTMFEGSRKGAGLGGTDAAMVGAAAGAGAGLTPEQQRAQIWSRRSLPPALKDEAAHLGLDSPEDRAFSDAWDQSMRRRLGALPTGRDILSKLDGELPPTLIRTLPNPNTLAIAEPGTGRVEFNATKIGEELRYHEPKLAVPSDPAELEKLLVKRPELLEKVADGAAPIMAHESTHIIQFQRYPRQLYPQVPEDDTVDQEKQAFIVENRYMLDGLKQRPGFLKSDSPLTQNNRNDFIEYYTRPDDFFHDIDAIRYHDYPTAAQLAKKQQEAMAEPAKPPAAPADAQELKTGKAILDNMSAGYGDFLAAARQSWRTEAFQGRGLLARGEAEVEPTFALNQSAALRAQFPEFNTAFQAKTVEQAAAASNRRVLQEVQGSPAPGSLAKNYWDYEAVLRENGKTPPAATAGAVRAKIRGELDQILGELAAMETGRIPFNAVRLEAGVADARFLGDSAAEGRLVQALRKLHAPVGAPR